MSARARLRKGNQAESFISKQKQARAGDESGLFLTIIREKSNSYKIHKSPLKM